jgi:hypothetical protein
LEPNCPKTHGTNTVSAPPNIPGNNTNVNTNVNSNVNAKVSTNHIPPAVTAIYSSTGPNIATNFDNNNASTNATSTSNLHYANNDSALFDTSEYFLDLTKDNLNYEVREDSFTSI